MENCKHYDKENGWCKLHSDWSEAMPVMEFCLLGPCGDYEEDFDCKWYQDEFCVNADSPCVADYCPCVEYQTLCRYYKGPKDDLMTKRKYKQLPGQLDLFDVIDNKKENDDD